MNTFAIGDLTANRLGSGAMRVPRKPACCNARAHRAARCGEAPAYTTASASAASTAVATVPKFSLSAGTTWVVVVPWVSFRR